MNIKINLPEKQSGFWVLMNFLNLFKHADGNIWINMDFAHADIIKEGEKKKYNYLDKKLLSFPLHYIMYMSLGDEFDIEGRKIRKDNFTFGYKEWDIHTEPEKLLVKEYNHDEFNNIEGRFPFDHLSNGMLYYDLYDFIKDGDVSISNGNKKIRMILPTSVIGQFFYFLETDFNKLLYSMELKHILSQYNKDNIVLEGFEKIGRFFYKWEYCKSYDTIAAMSNFLFSKKDQLLIGLHKAFYENLKSLRDKTDNIPFHYAIPLLSRLKIKVMGNYFLSDEGNVFVVRDILNYEIKDHHAEKLFTVDKIEYQPDTIFYSNGERRPEDGESDKPGTRRPKGKDSSEISGSSPANSKFKPRNITLSSKMRFGGIIPIEKSIDEKKTTRVLKEKFIFDDETSDGDTLYPTGDDKDGKKRGIKTKIDPNKEPRDEEKTRTYLSEVIKFFIAEYINDFNVLSFQIEANDIKADLVEINPKETDKYMYFIDAFEQRIQVVYSVNLQQYSKKIFQDVMESISLNHFNSWQPWRNSNYVFEGMEFDVSINRGVDNYVDDEFYKNEAKKFLKRIKSILG